MSAVALRAPGHLKSPEYARTGRRAGPADQATHDPADPHRRARRREANAAGPEGLVSQGGLALELYSRATGSTSSPRPNPTTKRTFGPAPLDLTGHWEGWPELALAGCGGGHSLATSNGGDAATNHGGRSSGSITGTTGLNPDPRRHARHPEPRIC